MLKIEGTTDTSGFARLEEVDDFHALAGGEYMFSLRTGASLNNFLTAAAAHLKISDIRSEDPSLHEIFLRAVNHERARGQEEQPR